MTKNNFQKQWDNDLVLHYKTHRLILGIMGVFLPLALIIGSFIWNKGQIENSISDYFYTCLRDLFVVTLSAVSIFLLTYKGYGGRDFWASNIAGFFGMITAFVSTNFSPHTQVSCHQLVEKAPYDQTDTMIVLKSDCVCRAYEITPVPHAEWLGSLHLGCASIFLLALAYMAIREFTLTNGGVRLKTRKKQLDVQEQQLLAKQKEPGADLNEIKNELWGIEVEREQMPKKVIENIFYRFCGWTIVVVLAILAPMVFSDAIGHFYDRYNIVFWGESICLVAFGTSWIIKGV
ncbi:MAG: hypothetical protein ACJ77K_00430 [Bacteroidia bacterium]